ncbi:MAG: hypothetical protein JRN52_12710 [Nitrososphaerota archaeon]|nr:hypothetical protein [Nitrososphaerota archaeon]
MKTALGLFVFLVAAFGLLIVLLEEPSFEFYTGGIFIAALMLGVFYVGGNTIRQTRNLAQKEEAQKQAQP